jgi:hypothetical protein
MKERKSVSSKVHPLQRWREVRELTVYDCSTRSGVAHKQWLNAERGLGLSWSTVVAIVRFSWKVDRQRVRQKRAKRQRIRYSDFLRNAKP